LLLRIFAYNEATELCSDGCRKRPVFR